MYLKHNWNIIILLSKKAQMDSETPQTKKDSCVKQAVQRVKWIASKLSSEANGQQQKGRKMGFLPFVRRDKYRSNYYFDCVRGHVMQHLAVFSMTRLLASDSTFQSQEQRTHYKLALCGIVVILIIYSLILYVIGFTFLLTRSSWLCFRGHSLHNVSQFAFGKPYSCFEVGSVFFVQH